MKKYFSSGGFTLFEILIVLAFIAVIGAIGVGYYFNYQRQTTLKTTAETISAFLYTTQQKSIGQEEASQWGVHFENPTGSDKPFYASFKGASYTEASEKRYLDNSLDFLYPADGSNVDVIFSRITGKVADGVFKKVQILLTPGTAVKAVNVSPVGVITINDGEVGWWKMDEGSGATTGDGSGYGATGTINGATWTSGKSNNALSFITGNNVDLGQPTSLDVANITVSGWVKYSTGWSGTPTLAGRDDGINRVWSLYQLSPNTLRFFVFVGDTARMKDTAFTPVADQWYHLTGTYDGNNVKIYVNGADVGSPTVATGNMDVDPVNTQIGDDLSSAHSSFNGIIDDVRIYDHALSADEVKHLYETTK